MPHFSSWKRQNSCHREMPPRRIAIQKQTLTSGMSARTKGCLEIAQIERGQYRAAADGSQVLNRAADPIHE